MTVEVLMNLTYLIPGMIILRGLGLNAAALSPLGYISGTVLYSVVALLPALLRLSTAPVWPIAATWIIAFAVGARTGARKPSRQEAWGLLAVVLGMTLLTWFVRTVNMYTWHSDSVRLVQAAGLVARSHFDWMAPDLLAKRMAIYPILHAPADLTGEYFMRSFAPLLAVFVAWTVVWMTFENLRALSDFSRSRRLAYALTLGFVLLSNGRFLWNATYVNAHLLCAAYLLMLAGSGWIALTADAIPKRALIALQSFAGVGLALVRAEGPLLATVALIPFIASPRLSKTERRLPLLLLGATTVVWHTYVWRTTLGGTSSHASPALALLGCFLVVVACFVGTPQFDRIASIGLVVLEPTVVAVVLVLGALKPDTLIKSVSATIENAMLGHGGWGSSLGVLWALVLVLLLFARAKDRVYLRVAITTFIPMSLLFAYLRNEPYRVGASDSLARALFHVVPLLVVFVGTGFASEWDRLSKTSAWLLGLPGLRRGKSLLQRSSA